MKRSNKKLIQIFILVYLCLQGFQSFSQIDSLARLMTRRPLSCWEIEYNCKILIPEYYAKGKIDSANILLNYWIKNCKWERNYEADRAKFLLSIQTGSFNEQDLKAAVFYQLTRYNNTKEMMRNGRHYYGFYYPYQTPDDSTFNVFIRTLAKNLKTKPLTPTEEFFSNFYSDTAIVHIDTIIKNKRFDGTNLRKQYKHYKDSIISKSGVEMGLYTGYFNPLGNNKRLGNKGLLGVFMGGYWGGNAMMSCWISSREDQKKHIM